MYEDDETRDRNEAAVYRMGLDIVQGLVHNVVTGMIQFIYNIFIEARKINIRKNTNDIFKH